MTRRSYKGFIIRANPFQLAKDGKWRIEISIERHARGKTRSRCFRSPLLSASYESAVKSSIEFGKKIIDEKVPRCSVKTL